MSMEAPPTTLNPFRSGKKVKEVNKEANMTKKEKKKLEVETLHRDWKDTNIKFRSRWRIEKHKENNNKTENERGMKE